MDSDQSKTLRQQLASAVSGGESHTTFEKVVEDFPADKLGLKPDGAPHSAWELVEHMRIAQWDILEFSRNPAHKSPSFPDGYWPETDAPPTANAWRTTVQNFQKDEKELQALIQQGDLFTPLPHGDGQTLFREACVVANHNSYHLGQLVFLKRMLLGKA